MNKVRMKPGEKSFYQSRCELIAIGWSGRKELRSFEK